MKAAEAIQKTGLILQEKFKDKGFNYKKADKCLIRSSGDFSYLVILYSTRGNKEGQNITLCVDLAINCYKEINDLNEPVGQLFYYKLLEQEHAFYNIATEELIEQSIMEISNKIEAILVPFIKKLEGDLNHYEQEWIKKGFFADKTGFVGSGLEFVINLKFIAAYFGKDKAAECLTNYLSTLSPEERQYFIKALSGKIEYKNFKPSVYVKYSDAKALGLKANY